MVRSAIRLVLGVLGVLFFAHALMLLGADEITSIENGWVRTLRPLGQILTLYGANPYPWIDATLHGGMATVAVTILSWPGWAVFGGVGIAFTLLSRQLEG